MKVLFTAVIITTVGFLSGVKAQNTTPDSLYNIGNDLYHKAKYGQAADLFEKAAKGFLEESDSLKWADAILRQGDALMNRGEVRKGRDLFLFVNERKPQSANAKLKAKINQHLGRIYRELEQYESSIDYYLKGIEFAEASGDSVLIATLNNNISYPYLYSGDYEQAFSHQIKAKQLYEATGKRYQLSFVLNGIFLTLRDLGLHAQADKYIQQSLDIVEKIGNTNLLDIAYHNKALSFNDLGKPDSAIMYYRKSLELSRMLENPYDITQTLINIGTLYERSGDYDNALAYYNEALETNYQTERPVSITNNLIRLARVAIQNNDFKNAKTFYREALTWLDESSSPKTLTNLYLDLAELEILQKNYPEAKEHLSKAREISRDKAFGTQQIRSHNLLGQLYKTEGKLHESLAEYRKAYDLYANQTATAKIAPAANLARAYHELWSDSAFMYAEEAFTLIDSIRTKVAGVAFRSGFFREHAGFYNEVASWYIIQKNNPEKTFELIEAAKARVLMDELAEAQEKVYDTLDEAMLIKKQQKAKQIDRLYNQLAEAESEEKKSAVRNELKDLEFEYQSFLNEIQTSNESLKEFKYPQPITLKQAQSMLDSKSAILEYAFTESGLTRLLITRDKITGTYMDSVGAETAKSYFTNHVREFREAILSGGKSDEIFKHGETLNELLIPAFSSAGTDAISRLIIIPGGALTYLPFEVLVNKNRYLIEGYNVKYLPSASIFQFIQPPHRATEYELFALAGSGFEGAGKEVTLTRSQSSYASLPSTLLEVDSIAVNFTNVQILKNEQVTEAAVKSFDLSQFRFLHFATHAIVNEQNPSQSGLILSRNGELEFIYDEDGFLNSREISGLRFNADLVTLSACNTGMGKFVTGEGLIGLQRSFLSAGASSVLVSLWSIFDRSTSVFMSKFYKQMLVYEKQDYGLWNQTLNWFGMYEHPLFDYKAKALRDAKLAMIEHPYYSHPVHWAPFVLIGK